MTTTTADLDAIRKLARQADDWAEYGHPNDPNWDGARTLIKQVPALLDELAEARDEEERYRQEARDSATQAGSAIRERDAAREELDKTRAELDAMTERRNVAVENAQQYRKNWDAAVAANMRAAEIMHGLRKQRDAVMTLCATTPDAELDSLPQRIREAYEASPATTAEPADEHTVWDHYGPCGYCGVTTGPCLNPDSTAPWPVERKVPAPKPHPRRQLADAATKADLRPLTETEIEDAGQWYCPRCNGECACDQLDPAPDLVGNI